LPAFVNKVVFQKTDGYAVEFQWSFQSIGDVNVEIGELYLNGGGQITSPVVLAPRCTLSFGRGIMTLTNTSSITESSTSIGISASTQFKSDLADVRIYGYYNLSSDLTIPMGAISFMNASIFQPHKAYISGTGRVTFNAVQDDLVLPYLALSDNGYLKLNTGRTVDIASVDFTGGTRDGPDVLSVPDLFWSAGTFSGAGATYATSHLTVIGDGDKVLQRNTSLASNITCEFSTSAAIYGYKRSQFIVAPGATFDIIFDSDFTDIENSADCTESPFFVNQGTVRVLYPTEYVNMKFSVSNQGLLYITYGTFFVSGKCLYCSGENSSMLLDGTGQITLQAAIFDADQTCPINFAGNSTLDVLDPSTIVNFRGNLTIGNHMVFQYGQFIFHDGCIVPPFNFDVILGANVTFLQTYNPLELLIVKIYSGQVNFYTQKHVLIHQLEIYGGYQGGLDWVDVSILFIWQGGGFQHPSTTASLSVTQISGTSVLKELNNGHQLMNYNSTTWTEGGTIVGRSGAIIQNLLNATFDTWQTVTFTCTLGDATFINQGRFNVQQGASTTTMGFVFYSTCVVTTSGTLLLTGGGNTTNITTLNPGSTIQFSYDYLYTGTSLISAQFSSNFGPVASAAPPLCKVRCTCSAQL